MTPKSSYPSVIEMPRGGFLPLIAEWGRHPTSPRDRVLLLAGDAGLELRGPTSRAVLERCRICDLWCVTSNWFGNFPRDMVLHHHEAGHEEAARDGQ